MTAGKTASTSKAPAKKAVESKLSVKPGEALKKKLLDRRIENATVELVGMGLDHNLVEKAVAALLKYHEKATEESDKHALFGSDRPLQVQFTLLRAPGQSRLKPIQIPIPHPFFKISDVEDSDGAEDPEICLIVKESSKPWCQEMIEKFPEHMGGVRKVLGLDSLRKKHSTYEQKRQLLGKYNLFMADDRILPMLSKLLGKAFIKSKRLPVPVSLTREQALPFAIQKALRATSMTINAGTCVSIRAGHTGMDAQKLVENITEITKLAVPKLPRKWANVQMIGIKTSDSISLPIYNKTPEALREIARLAGIEEPDVNVVPDDDEVEKGETNPKRKRDLKSPLLNALKKQKRAEKDTGHEHEVEVEMQSEKKAKKAKNTKKDDSGDEEPSAENVPRATTKKTKVLNSKKELKEDVSGKQEKTKKSTPKKEEVVKTVANTPATDTNEEPKKKKKDASETEEGSAPASEENEQKQYIAATKFKSSRKGYVFRTGKQGLGYYVDVKPVVNKMAIEAITRIGKNQNRRGGQKKNKYKGTRRF
jgi:ribosome biogenesis protein UTP30